MVTTEIFAAAEHSKARALRFGLQASDWPAKGGIGSARKQLQEQARRVEQAGFDVLTVADHATAIIPPLVSVQIAAEVTSTLRFGTFVLNNDFRHPALLARDVAAISLLCDGRFELGIGAGHNKAEYDALGLNFDPARVRAQRLDEAVALVRHLLDEERVTHSGAHYQLVDASTGVPKTSARIPILVGGNGRHVLTTAGRYADIVGLTAITPLKSFGHVHQPCWTDSYLEGRLAIVDAAATAAARATKPELNILIQHVKRTFDRRQAAETFCEGLDGLGLKLSVGDALTTPFLLFGTTGQMAEQIRATHERWGISYFTTRMDSFDTMAEVIQLLR